MQTSCVWQRPMPLLVDGGVGLLWESVGKADLPSDHFDSKQSRESVDLPLTGHPSPCLSTFAFRSSAVRCLLLDLDPHGGTDPLVTFPNFPKRSADVSVSDVGWLRFLIFLRELLMLLVLTADVSVSASRLSVVFLRLVCLSSFLACWRQANVTPIPKGPLSSSVANY